MSIAFLSFAVTQVSALETRCGYDIIVSAGQSNGASFGKGPWVDIPVSNSRTFQLGRFDNDSYKVIPADHYLQSWNGLKDRTAFAYTFGRKITQSISPNRDVLIIPAAKGSTGIVQWDKFAADGLYRDMVRRIKFSLRQNADICHNRVVAITWQQGEADMADILNPDRPGHIDGIQNALTVYSARLGSIFANLRNDVPGDWLFLIGKMVPDLLADDPPAYAMKLQFEGMQNSMINLNHRIKVVETWGLNSDVSEIGHFTGTSMIRLGVRYWVAWNDNYLNK
jgi:hypothetical protein